MTAFASSGIDSSTDTEIERYSCDVTILKGECSGSDWTIWICLES